MEKEKLWDTHIDIEKIRAEQEKMRNDPATNQAEFNGTPQEIQN